MSVGLGLGKLRYHTGGGSGGLAPWVRVRLNARFSKIWVKRIVFLTHEEKIGFLNSWLSLTKPNQRKRIL